MLFDYAINVENISKCFQIYENPRDRLKQFIAPKLQRVFHQSRQKYFKEFWALKEVNFKIKKGETVGIIGRNGSGKSTLLQMIAGTLNPTGGSIVTRGRVAALLELGSGFNPEFTGRENVYLNGAVLGLKREEIDQRFDEIASFADIGDFIEQPVKTYSSGMSVRLAFAVAICVNPEILIVDEALSVGDELFQRKCFSRIEQIRKTGATILFVSHAGGTVIELCDRAILLDAGELIDDGLPKKVVSNYQKLIYCPQNKRELIREKIRTDSKNIETDESNGKFEKSVIDYNLIENEQIDFLDPSLVPKSTISYVSHGATISRPGVYTLDGNVVNNLTRGKSYLYRFQISFQSPAQNVRFGMLIKTTSGVELGGGISGSTTSDSIPIVYTGDKFEAEFKFCCNLNAGVYFLNAGVLGCLNETETFLHRVIDAAMIRVKAETRSLCTGIIDFNCLPKVRPIE